MRKTVILLSLLFTMGSIMGCGGKKAQSDEGSDAEVAATTESAVPEYRVLENEQIDLSQFPVDKEGYITLLMENL